MIQSINHLFHGYIIGSKNSILLTLKNARQNLVCLISQATPAAMYFDAEARVQVHF